jgi:hypothetical protein
MLTPTQLEAIGRLTLAFNEIDEVVGANLAAIIECPEWSVSLLLAEGESFNRRTDLFRRVLDSIAAERPVVGPRIHSIQALLQKALEVSKKRNEFIHAVEYVDYEKNERMLRTKKKGIIPIVEQEIRDLADQAYAIAYQLLTECGELGADLSALRWGVELDADTDSIEDDDIEGIE